MSRERSWGSVSAFSREVIFRHAIPERIAGDLEEPAGFGNVAACALQCFFQHSLFHILNREAEGQERCLFDLSVRSRRLDISCRDREMIRLDHLVLTGNSEPFDHVVQFPHIAGPVVTLQDGQRGWGDAFDATAMIPSGDLQERCQNRLDIFGSLAERRDAQLVDV